MTKPYVPQEPGNPILAKDWNDLQIAARDHILTHTHSGGERGVKLTGEAIDPGATLTIKALRSGSADLLGPLTVAGGVLALRSGNGQDAGLRFPSLQAGGGADEAFIRRYPAGDAQRLVIGVAGRADDAIVLQQAGGERLTVRDGNVGIGNESPIRNLQVGPNVGGVGIEVGQSPNAGYIRFGDRTGWKLHIGRASESSGGGPNNGTTGVLLTVQDNGNVGIGVTSPSTRLQVDGEVRARSLTEVNGGWRGRVMAGGDAVAVLMGEWRGYAAIGAHNPALNAWADLAINPGGKTVLGDWTGDADVQHTIRGTAKIVTGGDPSWNRLVVTTTREWGDPNDYVTLGSGGAAGIMLSHPHVTWRDNRSVIRYGRTGGAAGKTWWELGIQSDGTFLASANDDGGIGPVFRLDKAGNARLRAGITITTSQNPLLLNGQHTGFSNNVLDQAEISNDTTTYKTLMLVGNRSGGGGIRRVGIWDRLDVNGTQFISGNLGTRGYDPNGGGIFPAGWGGGVHTWDLVCEASIIYNGGFSKYSSLRKKENVRPLVDALSIIDRLTPIRYDHRDRGPMSRECLGFIAEEVREVAPELVNEIDPDAANFFAASLRQDSLAALALAGIQALSRRVVALERALAGANATPKEPAPDRVEILAEHAERTTEGALEDYVAVRFAADDPILGRREVVRYLRCPADLDRGEFLHVELRRWKQSLER